MYSTSGLHLRHRPFGKHSHATSLPDLHPSQNDSPFISEDKKVSNVRNYSALKRILSAWSVLRWRNDYAADHRILLLALLQVDVNHSLDIDLLRNRIHTFRANFLSDVDIIQFKSLLPRIAASNTRLPGINVEAKISGSSPCNDIHHFLFFCTSNESHQRIYRKRRKVQSVRLSKSSRM